MDVTYASSSGQFVAIASSSSAARTFGIFVLIVVIVALVGVSGKWLYKQHQDRRYRHTLLSSANDDRVIITVMTVKEASG